MNFSLLRFCTYAILFLCSVSCGVKGPPLPPLAVTPQQSDVMSSPPFKPTVSDTPTPRPKDPTTGGQRS